MPSSKASHPLMASVRKLIAQRGPHLAILGPSGSGKSTLLQSLVLFLKKKGVHGTKCNCIELDLRNIIPGPNSYMYDQLSVLTIEKARSFKVTLNAGETFTTAMSKLSSSVDGYLVIVIDHLDDVPFEFAAQLVQHLRALKEMSEGGILPQNIGTIVSGCVSVFRLRRQDHSGLAQTAPFALPRSSTPDRKKLVQALTRQSGVKLSSEAIECLAEETGGEPAFLLPVLKRLRDAVSQNLIGRSEVSAAIEAVPFEQSPHLRRVLCSVLYDAELTLISLALIAGKQSFIQVSHPDIDQHQLNGAVVVDSDLSYRFRNKIVGRFIEELHGATLTPKSKSHALIDEIIEIKNLPNRVRDADDLWSTMPHLLRAWQLSTPFHVSPAFHLALVRAGKVVKWLEIPNSFDTNAERPLREATLMAQRDSIRERKNILAFDSAHVASASFGEWRDFQAALVTTMARAEVQLSEGGLEHWNRLATKAVPFLIRHALVESGLSQFSSLASQNSQGGLPNGRYDVFLSFASANRAKAEKIKADAEQQGIRLFFSTTDLETGARFSDQIREALRDSAEIWVLASPDSLSSVWVHTEWGAAWVLGKPIVPILFRSKPSDLPDRLESLQVIDYDDYPAELKRIKQKGNALAKGA